jgi:23S rRNA (uracil1939-C5)-methyltransferase
MELTIERLGHLGDGLAAGPIFVDRALPGEVVSGELLGDRLHDTRIVTPSEHRIAPQCSAFKRCGGCALHHAHPDFVAQWKQEVVVRALAAQGITAKIQAIHTSPENSRRRAKLTGRRTKKHATVGFFGKASETIQPIEPCRVLVPEILDIIPALEQFTAQFGSRKGQLGFWVLASECGIDVSVKGLGHLADADFGPFAHWAGSNGLARLSVGHEIICQHQAPKMTFGKVKITPPPRAFTQATEAGERALQAAVKRALAGADRIIDLFSGAGTLGLPLADVATLQCFENDAALLEALAHGVRHTQGIKTVTTSTRDLFRNPIDHTDLKPFNAAIIDPPRAGAEQQVGQLARSDLRDIAMVSCNPVSFARDAALLCNGDYSIKWIEVVDQFRWSPHIEIVAHFSKV